MSRPRQTLADYMVIAISPALIMAMVGSLVFFLIEVFYEGPYSARLCYISALFLFAAVLIARIAMVEGRAYASAFAFFLGIATWLAMRRFTQIMFPFDVGIIALIWWCADKLTWDCTLVDESKDPSSQGLMQTVGLSRPDDTSVSAAIRLKKSRREGEGIITAALGNPQAAVRDAQTNVKRWWSRRRPNKPGVWVVYFSLAALPLFGLGQWFIAASDAPARRYTFILLCVYLASGFGLLMTTSFLGLRHYLRKRQLQMPGHMAGVWLGAGALKIAVLLLFVSLLTFAIWMIPRQTVESSFARLPFNFSSPDDLKPSRYGIGKDGPQDDKRGKRPGKQSASKRSEQQQSPQPRSDAKSERGSSDDRQGQSQRQSDQSRSAVPQQDARRAPVQGEESEQGAQAKRNAAAPENGSESGGGKGSKSQATGSRSDGSQSQDASSGPSGSKKQTGESTRDRSDATAPRQSEKGESRAQSKADRSKSTEQSDYSAKPVSTSSSAEQERPKELPNQELDVASKPDQPQSSFDPNEMLSNVASVLGPLAKWIFYLVLACVVAFFLWFFRNEIRTAWARLVEQLHQLWQLLFGRAGSVVESDTAREEESGPPPRPFVDFPDPFASGAAARYSPDELVKYSFEAFEAWAREQSCARRPEQTPHELAIQVGVRMPSLATGARRLADLYCQLAYAPGSLKAASVRQLEGFWQQLRMAEALGGDDVLAGPYRVTTTSAKQPSRSA